MRYGFVLPSGGAAVAADLAEEAERAEGTTEPGRAGDATVRDWAAAGATWWLDANWGLGEDKAVERSRERPRAGPPRG